MARVAAIGVKLAKRIRSPLIPPTDETSRDHERGLVVVYEERSNHDQKSGERSDRQVDGPKQQGDSLTKCNEAQGGGQGQNIVDVECRQEIGILAEDIKSQKNSDERERNRGRIV